MGTLPQLGGAGHGFRRSGGRSSARGPRHGGGVPSVKGEGYVSREKSRLMEVSRRHSPPHSSFPTHSLGRIREWRKEVKNGGGAQKKGKGTINVSEKI